MTQPSVLRRWRPVDGPWYVAQVSDPQIQRFTTDSPDTVVDDFLLGYAQLDDDAGRFGRAIIDPGTGSLSGNVAASLDGDVAEISYWLAASARGRGLARRAVAQSIDILVAAWPGLGAVVLSIDDDNIASTRLAQALGFVRESSRDKDLTVRGAVRHRQAWRLALNNHS